MLKKEQTMAEKKERSSIILSLPLPLGEGGWEDPKENRKLGEGWIKP